MIGLLLHCWARQGSGPPHLQLLVCSRHSVQHGSHTTSMSENTLAILFLVRAAPPLPPSCAGAHTRTTTHHLTHMRARIPYVGAHMSTQAALFTQSQQLMSDRHTQRKILPGELSSCDIGCGQRSRARQGQRQCWNLRCSPLQERCGSMCAKRPQRLSGSLTARTNWSSMVV